MIKELLESDLENNPNPMPIRLTPDFLKSRGFTREPDGRYIFVIEDRPVKKVILSLNEELKNVSGYHVYSYRASRIVSRHGLVNSVVTYEHWFKTTHEINVILSYLQEMTGY